MKISEQVYDYISDTQNYDMEDVLEKLTEELRSRSYKFKNMTLDECSIYWGNGNDSYVDDLENYTIEVFKKACELVVNVIESFESEGE
jgi:hypothetical protein